MKSDNNVQSVDRALDIIEVLSEESGGLGITEIAKRLNMNKSTVHRIAATLLNRGYLAKDRDGSYKIGLELIRAVGCYINSLELQTEARTVTRSYTSKKWTSSPMCGSIPRSAFTFTLIPALWENAFCPTIPQRRCATLCRTADSSGLRTKRFPPWMN